MPSHLVELFSIVTPLILRAALLVAVAFCLVFVALKCFRIRSPKLHRLSWVAVLLSGWFVLVSPDWMPVVHVPVSTITDRGLPEGNSAVIDRGLRERIRKSFGNSAAENHRQSVSAAVSRPLSGGVESTPHFRIETVLAILWLVGILLGFLRLGWRYCRFQRFIAKAQAARDDWTETWKAVLAERKIRRKIPMLVSDAAGPALVHRIFGYVLVVPRNYWESLAPEARLTVLRHEREHYLRRDGLKSFFVRLLSLPQWFHPLAHVAVRRFDEAAEWACDEAACDSSSEAVSDFAAALVALHESARSPARLSILPGFASRKPSARILRLVQLHETPFKKDSLMKKLALLTLVVLILSAGLFQVRLDADQKELETSPTPTTSLFSMHPESRGFTGPVPWSTPSPSSPELPAASAQAFPAFSTTATDDKVEVHVVKLLVADGEPYEMIETSLMPRQEAEAQGYVPVRTQHIYEKPKDQARADTVQAISHARTAASASSVFPPARKPDVSKFRIAIEYKLKSVTPESLAEFLQNEFAPGSVEFEDIVLPKSKDSTRVAPANPAYFPGSGGYTKPIPAVKNDALTIKASIEDHKTIKKLLVEIEAEVEGLKKEAADAVAEKQVKVFTLRHIPATESFVKELAAFVSKDIQIVVENVSNSLIVSGTPGDMSVLEALLLNLDDKNPKPLPGYPQPQDFHQPETYPTKKAPNDEEVLPPLDPEGVSRRIDFLR